MHRERGVPERFVGSTLGSFRLTRLIGAGGTAYVFGAQHEADPAAQEVALKMLRPEHHTRIELRRRFEREATAAAKIRHPRVLSVGPLQATESGRLFFVQELLVGVDLADRLAETRKMSLAQSLRIVADAAAGLGAAHAAGVVHRDIKPENLFLEGAGDAVRTKVLDFGFAWVEGDSAGKDGASRITARSRAIGTPEYMAPEQLNAPVGRPSADIYSLGVVLFELVTGSVPHRARSHAELARVYAESPPSLRERCPNLGVSEPLEAFLSASLALAPERRPPSTDAWLEWLRATPEGRRSLGG